MARPVPPPRILTLDLAARLGISRSRVRTEIARGTWRRLAVGIVLTRPDDPGRDDWALLGLALAGPEAAITGWDALRPRGLGGASPPTSQVLVISPCAMNRVVGAVRIRRTRRAYSRHMVPLGRPARPQPVVAPARAVADTALQYRRQHRDAITLVTSSLQRGVCTLPDLIDEYRAGPRRDSAGLHRALSVAADGARSVAEAQAARRLSRGAIPAFELNVPIVDQGGVLLYVVDVLWRHLRAGLEIDSREYHAGFGDWERTLARHNDLTRWGLSLLHYPPARVTARGSTFVPDVADWLARRAAELGTVLSPQRGVRRPSPGAAVRPLVVHR